MNFWKIADPLLTILSKFAKPYLLHQWSTSQRPVDITLIYERDPGDDSLTLYGAKDDKFYKLGAFKPETHKGYNIPLSSKDAEGFGNAVYVTNDRDVNCVIEALMYFAGCEGDISPNGYRIDRYKINITFDKTHVRVDYSVDLLGENMGPSYRNENLYVPREFPYWSTFSGTSEQDTFKKEIIKRLPLD